MEGDRSELSVGQEAQGCDERDQHPVHPAAQQHHRLLQPLHGQEHAADRAGVLQRYHTHTNTHTHRHTSAGATTPRGVDSAMDTHTSKNRLPPRNK